MARTDLMVAELHARLAERGRTWVKFSTLVDLADRKRANEELIEEIEAALEVEKIHHSPTDLRICAASDTVLLSSEPFHDGGLPFGNERELSEFIERHYRLLPPFVLCRRVDHQVQVEGGDVRIDLLFKEKDGSLIVCELEHGDGRFETGSQIRRYIKAVRDSFTPGEKQPKIRGVVITGEPNKDQEDEVARWCQEDGVKIDWYYYRLGLALTSAPPPVFDEVHAGAAGSGA
jgi:hypothetical protein